MGQIWPRFCFCLGPIELRMAFISLKYYKQTKQMPKNKQTNKKSYIYDRSKVVYKAKIFPLWTFYRKAGWLQYTLKTTAFLSKFPAFIWTFSCLHSCCFCPAQVLSVLPGVCPQCEPWPGKESLRVNSEYYIYHLQTSLPHFLALLSNSFRIIIFSDSILPSDFSHTDPENTQVLPVVLVVAF